MPDTEILTALYVDFDNVFSSLREFSLPAAKSFSENPRGWLEWFEDGLHESDDATWRRILVRRCYLNPSVYRSYRAFFVQSGFTVIDTPSLTGSNKSAGDVHMLMDILDSLRGPVSYAEYIILTSDADFTPVMIRLREHNRITAMLAKAQTAAALRASCDHVIPLMRFIEDALLYDEQDRTREPQPFHPPSPAQHPPSAGPRENGQLQDALYDTIRKLLAESETPILSSTPLGAAILEVRLRRPAGVRRRCRRRLPSQRPLPRPKRTDDPGAGRTRHAQGPPIPQQA